MCGINGFNFKDKSLIKDMNETLKHRGPDDNGIFEDDNITFGHTRLTIVDLSKNGSQPMTYDNGNLVITYNGEIFNYKDIKKELIKLKHKFNSNSDTEVILASYKQWGEKCLIKFNGMFAFSIYDKKKKELFLARDRFGKKPLYYYNKNNKFIFSSEIKAILNYNINKDLDKKSINEFFTYRFTFEDRTIFENIKNFKPSHYMVYDIKNNEIKKYKKYYSLEIKERDINLNDAKDELKFLIEDSVKLRMESSDVEVATLLSGGLDSSIITAIAKKHNPKLHTFSIGFDTTNELSYAKLVSEHLDTIHHELKINKDSVLDYLEDMVYHMDEPIGADPGFLPIFVLSKEVKKFNKVVLTGDGADEIFTGYDRYKLFYYGKHIKKLPLMKSKNEIINRLKSMKGKNDFESFIEITRVFEKDELIKLNLKESVSNKSWEKENLSPLNKAQIFDINNLLPKDFFMKADKMSSAFGLEQRSPFMDYRIVELGLSLPIKLRLKGWNEKHILKETFKDILPKEITKRKKHGFNVPIDYWFENTLGDKLKTLMKNSKHNLYDNKYIFELLKELKENKTNFKSRNIIAQKLWSVLIFEMWHKRFVK